MKKMFLICVTLMFSSSVMAITCEEANGFIMKGNNGVEYCVSNNYMNWWTAIGWCQIIGKTMIQYPKDCSCAGEGCPKGVPCPNFAGMDKTLRIWTSTAIKETEAIDIETSGAGVIRMWPRTGQHNAVCY